MSAPGDKKRIHLNLRTLTTQVDKLDDLVDDIETELDTEPGYDTFSIDSPAAVNEDTDDPTISIMTFQVRFDAGDDLFETFLTARVENTPDLETNLLVGSKITTHQCPHHKIETDLHICAESIFYEKL